MRIGEQTHGKKDERPDPGESCCGPSRRVYRIWAWRRKRRPPERVRMMSSLSRKMRVRKLTRRPLSWKRFKGLRHTDALLISYPRSGNTWLRFLLYEALSGKPAEFRSVQDGVPGPGRRQTAAKLLPGGGSVMATHDRYRSHDARSVYIVRDVRDVLLSEHRAVRRGALFDGSLDDFLPLFLEGRVNPYGSWADHIRYWLGPDLRGDGGVLRVRFEDLRNSTEETLSAILAFLGAERSSETIRNAIESNTVERMKAKEDRADDHVFVKADPTAHFVGRGLVGGWRDALTDEQLRMIERHAGDVMAPLGYRLEAGSA
jgi:hypothetical protein